MLRAFAKFRKEIREKLVEFEDYIIDHKGYERGLKEGKQQVRSSAGLDNITLPKEVIKIILWLVAAVLIALGVKELP